MTTYIINPITDELESAQPRQTVGDKFKLQTFVREKFSLGTEDPSQEMKTADDKQTTSVQVLPKLSDVLVPGQTGLALRRVSSESVFVQKSANQSRSQRTRALSFKGIGQDTDSTDRLSAVKERLQRMEGMLSQLVASMDPAAKKGP